MQIDLFEWFKFLFCRPGMRKTAWKSRLARDLGYL